MDEQTTQGSTALMLACKRGHERCAEVLVTMGQKYGCMTVEVEQQKIQQLVEII